MITLPTTVEGRPILVVDDDPDVPLLLEHLFRSARIEERIVAVTDVSEGMALLEQMMTAAAEGQASLPLLILVDLKLPAKSGFELLAWLQTRPELKAVPRIVLSCSVDEREVERAFATGANGFLIKYPAPATFAAIARLARERQGIADLAGHDVVAAGV